MAKPQMTMEMMLQGNKEKIRAALPKGIQVDRTIALASGLWSQNAELQKCTPNSFATSVFQAVSMGLELSPLIGHVYLIPYNNKKKGVTECQLQVGYKGLIELAKRSKDNPKIWARVVYANDSFDYELGSKEYLKHTPYLGKDRGEFMAAYACLETSDGSVSFEIVPAWEILEIRDRFSKSGDKYGPWTSSFDEMAKKTATKRLLKYASLSAELQQVIHQDDLSSIGAPQESIIDLKDVTPEPEPKEIIKPAPKEEEKKAPPKSLSDIPNSAPNAAKGTILQSGPLRGQAAETCDLDALIDYVAEAYRSYGTDNKNFPAWFKASEEICHTRIKEREAQK